MQEFKNENLIKEQMKVISDLQERIRLLEFDKSMNLKEIKELKIRAELRRKTINKVKEKLVEMSRENDFSNISHVLNLLKKGHKDEQE